MEHVNTLLLIRIFFITILALQIIFIIKKILFHLHKKQKHAAYYFIGCYKEGIVFFLCSNFFYISTEITKWRGFNGLNFSIVMMMIFDIISLMVFAFLSKPPYEVYVYYKTSKKKIMDLNRSYIVVYNFWGCKKLVFLNQIDAKKSQFVRYKLPSIVEAFIDPIYAYIVLNDDTKIKIKVSTNIVDPEIGIYDIRHVLKIPAFTATKVNGKWYKSMM